jgi:hypothetical protein
LKQTNKNENEDMTMKKKKSGDLGFFKNPYFSKKEINDIKSAQLMTGSDITLLQSECGASLNDIVYALGLTLARFYSLTSSRDGKIFEPIKSPSRAILMRILFQMIEEGRNYVPVPTIYNSPLITPDVHRITDMLLTIERGIRKMQKIYAKNPESKTYIPLFLGTSGTATYRNWLKGSAPNPDSQRVIQHVYSDIIDRGEEKAMRSLILVLEKEAFARGCKNGFIDVLKMRKWPIPDSRGKIVTQKRKPREALAEDGLALL